MPNILVVHPSDRREERQGTDRISPRASPTSCRSAPPASATGTHLAGELFKVLAGVKMVHVPYPGSPQAVTDLLAGRIQLMFCAGLDRRCRTYATASSSRSASTEAKRTALAPELPTMIEPACPASRPACGSA